MENLVEVKNLAVSYFTYAGEVQSVRGVTFDIKKGKTTAIVGESGCGKTVTAKSLIGLIHRPGKILEGSQVLFAGKDLMNFSRKEWDSFRGKECSMIFQDALVSLNPTMKIGKQITENLSNHEKSTPRAELKKKVVEILELVEIPDAGKISWKISTRAFRWYASAGYDRNGTGNTSGTSDRRRTNDCTGCDNTGTDHFSDERVTKENGNVDYSDHT